MDIPVDGFRFHVCEVTNICNGDWYMKGSAGLARLLLSSTLVNFLIYFSIMLRTNQMDASRNLFNKAVRPSASLSESYGETA
jgi:hypothetical protein